MEWEKVKVVVDKLYKRPKQFSDEYTDFSQEELDKLIATPDEAMACDEFMCIFQSYCPAGSYEESAYFIPLLVKYLETNPSEASDALNNWFGWVDQNKEALEHDGLWSVLVPCYCKIMSKALLNFKICRKEDFCRTFFYPFDVSLLEAFISPCILKPAIFASIVSQKAFYEHFENIDTYPAAAWLVYLGTTDWFDPVPSYTYIAARLAIAEVRDHARQLIIEQCQANALNAEFWAPILPELDRLYGPQA